MFVCYDKHVKPVNLSIPAKLQLDGILGARNLLSRSHLQAVYHSAAKSRNIEVVHGRAAEYASSLGITCASSYHFNSVWRLQEDIIFIQNFDQWMASVGPFWIPKVKLKTCISFLVVRHNPTSVKHLYNVLKYLDL